MIGNDVKNNKRLPSNFWNPSGLLGYSLQNTVAYPSSTYVPQSSDIQIPKKNKIRMLTSGDMAPNNNLSDAIVGNNVPNLDFVNEINSNFNKMGVENDIGLSIKESIAKTTEPYWIFGGHTYQGGPKVEEYEGNQYKKSHSVSWDSLKTWIDQNPNIKKAFFPGCNTGESCTSLSKLPPSDKFYFPKYNGEASTQLYNLGDNFTVPLSAEKAGLLSMLLDNGIDLMYQKESELELLPGEDEYLRFGLGEYDKITPDNHKADSLMNLLVNKLADKKIINKRTYKPINEEWDY
jgi:hypothetical protein